MRPILAIASTPQVWARAVRRDADVSMSSQIETLVGARDRSAVGSVTIAASAVTRMTTLAVPMEAYSSSATRRNDHIAAQPSLARRRADRHDRREAPFHVERAAT
jgi:hypothetical protein